MEVRGNPLLYTEISLFTPIFCSPTGSEKHCNSGSVHNLRLLEPPCMRSGHLHRARVVCGVMIGFYSLETCYSEIRETANIQA